MADWIYVNSCRIKVRIKTCYRCCSTSGANLEVRLQSLEVVENPDGCELTYDAKFWGGVDNIISHEGFYNNSYECAGVALSCIQGGIPLCSSGKLFSINFYRANCYRRDFSGIDTKYLFRLVPCKGTGACKTSWSVCCKDGVTLQSERISIESVGGCYEYGSTTPETDECYPACW